MARDRRRNVMQRTAGQIKAASVPTLSPSLNSFDPNNQCNPCRRLRIPPIMILCIQRNAKLNVYETRITKITGKSGTPISYPFPHGTITSIPVHVQLYNTFLSTSLRLCRDTSAKNGTIQTCERNGMENGVGLCRGSNFWHNAGKTTCVLLRTRISNLTYGGKELLQWLGRNVWALVPFGSISLRLWSRPYK
jgi:hypothetical protein